MVENKWDPLAKEEGEVSERTYDSLSAIPYQRVVFLLLSRAGWLLQAEDER